MAASSALAPTHSGPPGMPPSRPQRRCTTLVEVPSRARPGDRFAVAMPGGRSVMPMDVVVPDDAGPGDVLQVDVPSGRIDDFLARLGHAEMRDTSMPTRGRPTGLDADLASPSYGWRMKVPPPHGAADSANSAGADAFNPYQTEQQRQQLAMNQAHQQAIARAQQRARQEELDRLAMMRSGAQVAIEVAERNAAPGLAARPPPALRREQQATADAATRQRRTSAGLYGGQRMDALEAAEHRSPPLYTVGRAPNAAAAQNEATLIARQQQARRDPRGRAFR